MKKILFICPHLSTGGSGQVTVNKIELLKDQYDILVVEYSNLAYSYVVQKNRIIDLLGNDKLISFERFDAEKKQKITAIINGFKPDFIFMEEFPEFFMPDDVALEVYKKYRDYKIFETTHDSTFENSSKKYFPDKFIFVSPYSAIKCSGFDIPYEIIEYPVDKPLKSPALASKIKSDARKKLNLSSEYKHVINIGLFTPRKNQKYIFELATIMKEWKIQFHFLGNQASNFQDYWQPLMQLKESEGLDNCVVWGERDDTDDFLKASELFLFTSRGGRTDKELNPIAIKEALANDIPMLMFNLDVYCGKYNDIDQIKFLTGDLEQDKQMILNQINPMPVNNTDELIILGTYPNTKERNWLTIDSINSLKYTGRKIMLLSHYSVSEEIQRMVDYYVFDAYNPLTHHSYYTHFYNQTSEYHAKILINGLKDTNQSLTVLTNMFNGFKAAKNLGYKSAFYITYDVIVHEDDIDIINQSFAAVRKSNTAYLGTLNTPFGKGIQTTAMTMNVDWFLNTFDDVRSAEDYNKICQAIGAQNFLEDYMMKKVQHLPNIELITNDKETILVNSGVGVSSNSEYYSILPVVDSEEDFMFYFYTYNIDSRKVNLIVKEDGQETFNMTYVLKNNREFKKALQFKNNTVEVFLDFYDGSDIYKQEHFVMNSQNIEKYRNTGFFKINKKPKIKLVHLQTTYNLDKEQLSRDNLMKLKDYGIEYVLHQNQPYTSLPPAHNCMREQCVSMELFSEENVQRLGTALTPAHFGCFESFKNGILTEFSDDVDFLICCEGDCLIEVPYEQFISKLYQACDIIKSYNIGYFSFGDKNTLDFQWEQSKVIEVVPNQDLLFITDHIIGLQMIMFPKKVKPFLFETLRTHKWDAADMYFNSIFRYSQYKMGIVKERLTTQADGISLIDQQEKVFVKKK